MLVVGTCGLIVPLGIVVVVLGAAAGIKPGIINSGAAAAVCCGSSNGG